MCRQQNRSVEKADQAGASHRVAVTISSAVSSTRFGGA
jgi:hypothetical protein